MRLIPKTVIAITILAAGACCIILGCSASQRRADSAQMAHLCSQGRALIPVVVGPQASERTRKAAATLADYLGRMGDAAFVVQTGEGNSGIVVGRPDDFAALPFEVHFEQGPFHREDYLLRSRRDGLWLLGATELAVEHAVWDLLYRLGYRQFFPGATWEVVPRSHRLAIAVDDLKSPDFYARRIWYNWGMHWGYNVEPYRQWCARNRCVQGFQLNSGHAYESIIAARRQVFQEHPEYYALVNGERKGGGDAKFCVSNPDLRKVVVEYAVERVRHSPDIDSLSMEPSDGGNWCECEPCAEMGSISDRALTLANEVAAAINELGLGEKYVGMYAYHQHSPPPNIPVHPNVIISVATAFLRGGYTLDQIIDGWAARGATLGIYDYFSVMAWDWNMPRRARSARPKPLADSIRRYYDKGARFYDAESGNAWGPYGLGFYVASRVMWDISEADRVDELIDDFLTRAFGPAKRPMAAFYELIAEDTQRRSDSDLLGRMYRHLAEARTLAANASDVQRRIDDLILYTRYAEMFSDYAAATGDAKQAARDAMLRHAYRMRKTMMVHVYALWARTIGQGAAHQPKHPLMSDEPFTDAEILQFLEHGIRKHTPVETGFEPVAFSTNLRPAAKALNLPHVEPGQYPTVPQNSQTYYIWLDQVPATISLKVTVQHVWNLRPHQILLTWLGEDGEQEQADSSDVVRPDGKTYDVNLTSQHAGLHRVDIRDGGDHTRIVRPEGMPVVIPSGADTSGAANHFRGQWSLYFYVPKGTKVVGGWAERIAQWAPPLSGTLRDGDGQVRYTFAQDRAGWFAVPVPPEQDGRLWKFDQSHGLRLLMTVPPYLARTAGDILLPEEVIARDSQ